MVAERRRAHGVLQGRQQDRDLGQGLRRAAGFRDGDEAGAPEVERGHERAQGVGVDVVEEVQARAAVRRAEAAVGEGRERLPAERGAAGAEHHDMIEPAAPVLGEVAQVAQILGLAHRRERRQAARVDELAQAVVRRGRGHEHAREDRLAHATLADRLGQAGLGEVLEGHGHGRRRAKRRLRAQARKLSESRGAWKEGECPLPLSPR